MSAPAPCPTAPSWRSAAIDPRRQRSDCSTPPSCSEVPGRASPLSPRISWPLPVTSTMWPRVAIGQRHGCRLGGEDSSTHPSTSPGWRTLETIDLGGTLRRSTDGRHGVDRLPRVVVQSDHRRGERLGRRTFRRPPAIQAATSDLCEAIRTGPARQIVLVSNEVGSGVVPPRVGKAVPRRSQEQSTPTWRRPATTPC